MALAAWPQSTLIPVVAGAHPQADVIALAREQRFAALAKTDLWDLPFVVVDIETTGSVAGRDGITEIALVAVRAGRIERCWRSFVNPFQPIPVFITQLTGISDDMVKNAPRPADILPLVVEFVGDAVLVGHNVRFDAHFIDRELCRHGHAPLTNVCIDTLALARRTIAEVPNYKLGTLSHELGIDVERHHRALADATATAQLLVHCVKRLEDCAVFTLGSLREYLQIRPATRRRASITRRLPDASQLPVWTSVLLEELSGVPSRPGVYTLRDAAGDVVYIGKSRNLRQRLRAYATLARPAGPKMSALRSVVASFSFTVTGSELEALLLEADLVRTHNPPFNDRLRNFREFAFIKIEAGANGRLVTTAALSGDGARYYGPYRSMPAAQTAVVALADALGLHSADVEDQAILPPAQREALLEDAAAFIEGRGDEVLLTVARRRDEAAARGKADIAQREDARLDRLRRLRSRHAALELNTGLNAVVMAASPEPSEEACFLFCGGRLAAQARLPRRLPDRARAQALLSTMLRENFQPQHAPRCFAKQHEIDQLYIFSSWYRERKEGLHYAPLPDRPALGDEAHHWAAAILDGDLLVSVLREVPQDEGGDGEQSGPEHVEEHCAAAILSEGNGTFTGS
ncbi:MAG: exonuclease domain-containing protein [Candidatus Eremiobacteraeota bacterium]|nr:exonuclease domain-containing protein [Candidatus Eremiobacteraeota bacterium]